MVLREVSRGVSRSATELNRRVKGIFFIYFFVFSGIPINVVNLTIVEPYLNSKFDYALAQKEIQAT